MDIVTQLVQLVSLVVSIMMIVAILRVFSIHALMKKILAKLDAMDKHRREEFEAMTQGE